MSDTSPSPDSVSAWENSLCTDGSSICSLSGIGAGAEFDTNLTIDFAEDDSKDRALFTCQYIRTSADPQLFSAAYVESSRREAINIAV